MTKHVNIFLLVINQMDTSQAHLGSKAPPKDTHKPDNLSKDELHAVLKYGAQKMFVLACHRRILFPHLVFFVGSTKMIRNRTKSSMRWILMTF